ncbi:MAG: DEAD/DEAH box helicase, partial [archaeon]
MKTFNELGLSKNILAVIEADKFEQPSEIQAQAIPQVLQGKDIIAGSATGSGKTLVFAAGIIQNLVPNGKIQSLILTPTRELAEQVKKSISHFSKNSSLKVTAVYGGLAINPQIDKLRTADVVVGTPGRVLDHIDRDTLPLDDVKILVLDEADKMLEMGFIEDVEKIIRNCPKNRQTLLFSATVHEELVTLAEKYMKSPIEISTESYVSLEKLPQIYYDVPTGMKFSLLVHLLKKEKSDLVMVFCNTRTNTDFVAKNLRFNNIKALAIHGGFSQNKRDVTMNAFKEQDIRVLVCTDVAARGLDIKGISHIYNYDVPKNSKDYIHRIGRTARAGKSGKAISILSSRDYDNFSLVLKDDSLKIPEEPLPKIERVSIKWFDSSREESRFGSRRGGSSRGGSGGGRSYRRSGGGSRGCSGGGRSYRRWGGGS